MPIEPSQMSAQDRFQRGIKETLAEYERDRAKEVAAARAKAKLAEKPEVEQPTED